MVDSAPQSEWRPVHAALEQSKQAGEAVVQELIECTAAAVEMAIPAGAAPPSSDLLQSSWEQLGAGLMALPHCMALTPLPMQLVLSVPTELRQLLQQLAEGLPTALPPGVEPVTFWKAHLHLAAFMHSAAGCLLHVARQQGEVPARTQHGRDSTLAALLALAARCLGVLVDSSAAPDAEQAAQGRSIVAHAWLALLDVAESSSSRIGRGSLGLDLCFATAEQALRHLAALAPAEAAGQLESQREGGGGSLLARLTHQCCQLCSRVLQASYDAGRKASSSGRKRELLHQQWQLHSCFCRLLSCAAGRPGSSPAAGQGALAEALDAACPIVANLLCGCFACQLDSEKQGVSAVFAAAQCEATLALADVVGGVDALISKVSQGWGAPVSTFQASMRGKRLPP